ncbi:hypothetical protein [Marinobacter sp. SS8-8]|uniref:bacteriophage T4 gp5 trimerisation domain-containing protein n=1 Tax=Marinobacter sp. SS8-8 TaxID=3050452 RepID=UPI000C39E227|nr:hypothetical protein [Marinobacter sp. SS8-8]MAZ04978.1 hypothetical protein [Halomonas sp.]|tara:strand:- start:15 stop:296 length:282 start_codon:yes stop_codon:yes gene_type:complete
MPQANGLQFTARIGGRPRDFFAVVGLELTESLSSLFHGRLDLAFLERLSAEEGWHYRYKGEGSNELRLEDEADKEQVYIHAQKDLDLLTGNNR